MLVLLPALLAGCAQDLDLGTTDLAEVGGPDVSNTIDMSEPDMPSEPPLDYLTDVTDLSVGWGHACAIRLGELWCWGANDLGQLGLGDGANRFTATRVGTDADWMALEIGSKTTCAVKTDESLWCWGENIHGQVGDGTTSNRAVPTLIDFPGPIAQLEGGENHFCAVTTSAELYCWGDNRESQLGQGSNQQTGVPFIEVPTQVTADEGVGWLRVGCGGGHTCAIRSDNVALCWGRNTQGMSAGPTDTQQVLVPSEIGRPEPPTRGWTNVLIGAYTTYLQAEDGVWYGVGEGNSERLPGLSSDTFEPAIMTLPISVEPASLADFHACGLDEANALYCWGQNLDGIIADSQIGDVIPPSKVGDAIGSVELVETGRFNTCALTRDDRVFCRGENSSGAVGGNAPSGDSPRWVQVGSLPE